ncbi:MAG: hypothetical protein EP324_00800 [Gammaproteobacteria bacterium]|nr:MAG: hypothetical protein EP324_00800 [Gammaproteobacteria bacterium]
MKPAHLNLGLHFARPYESDYALLRRCLIANPGMPLSAIEEQLRQQLPTLTTTYQRLRALQQAALPGHPYQALDIKETYRHQCPQCAEQLYHCDLYALPWLSHCPIHHCELTEHCPRCQRPWPDKGRFTLRNRSCPVCGIPSVIEGLPRSLSDKDCDGFDTIKAIYELIALDPGGDDFVISTPGDPWEEKAWWTIATPDSPRYPLLKAQLDLKQYRPLLKTLGIPLCRLRRHTTRLRSEPPAEKLDHGFYVPPTARPDPLLRQSAIDQTMARIVSWIADQGHTGELHILSYRYLYTGNLMREPPPCPYCMALSLWFFQVNSELYDDRVMDLLHHYPFLNELRLTQHFTGVDPDVVTFDAAHPLKSLIYRTDDKFMWWFMQRGLELAFVQMLFYAFALVMQFDLSREPPSCPMELVGPLPRTWEDQWYLAYILNGRLYFYYENEHPLEHLEPPKLPGLTGLCLNYCQHRQKISHDSFATAFTPIPLPTLTPELCKALHNDFERYLENMYRHPVQF